MSISLAIRNIRSVFDDWRRECRIRRLVWTMDCLHRLGWRGRFDGAAAKAPFPAVLVIFRPGQLREMGEPVPVSMLVVPKGC